MFKTLIGGLLGNFGSAFTQHVFSRNAQKYGNRFNHPKNQIKRLKEAGLSPSMMYARGQTIPADVGRETPNIEGDLGVSRAIEGSQRIKGMSMREKMLSYQLDLLRHEAQGQKLENEKKEKEIKRYDSDRDLWNFLKTRDSHLKYRAQDFQEQIGRRRASIQEEANLIAKKRLGFDKEKWEFQKNLEQSYYDLKRAKTYEELRLARENYLLDAARVMIQRGQLNISLSELNMKWKKYRSDYALWNAIDSAFEGNIDWKSIAKQGVKSIPRAIAKGLKRFLFK